MSIRAWKRETSKLGIQKLVICKLFCPLWLSASSFLKQEGAGVMLRPLTCPGYITGCVWESTEAMYVKSAVKMSRLLQKVQALLYIFWRSQLISASSPGTIFRSNHFRQKLDLGSWSRKNHPFNAVPKNDLTCIWAAAINHMVLIPTCTWFMKCSLGSREHFLGASSTLVLRRLICLWPGRMNFLLGCGETVRLLASSKSWLDDCAHLWKSAILMRAGLRPWDRADTWFLSPKAPPLLTSRTTEV